MILPLLESHWVAVPYRSRKKSAISDCIQCKVGAPALQYLHILNLKKLTKKLIAVGDSLALPGHLNNYEDTWFYRLKKDLKDYDCIPIFRRGITSEILVSEGGGGVDNLPMGADCLEFYKPDIVILQLGIVDCAPRLFKRDGIENKIINRIPYKLKDRYIKIVKKLRTR